MSEFSITADLEKIFNFERMNGILDPARERFGDDFGLGEVKAHDRASSRGQGPKRPKAPRPQGEKEESFF